MLIVLPIFRRKYFNRRLREGRKIIGSTRDLFSSCFELPSPAGTGSGSSGQASTKLWGSCGRSAKSLPTSRRESLCESGERVDHFFVQVDEKNVETKKCRKNTYIVNYIWPHPDRLWQGNW
jgi:hypothetical protein